jgi:hypothetical protein
MLPNVRRLALLVALSQPVGCEADLAPNPQTPCRPGTSGTHFVPTNPPPMHSRPGLPRASRFSRAGLLGAPTRTSVCCTTGGPPPTISALASVSSVSRASLRSFARRRRLKAEMQLSWAVRLLTRALPASCTPTARDKRPGSLGSWIIPNRIAHARSVARPNLQCLRRQAAAD